MQGGRQEREHCHLCLGRAGQPHPARGHHQADQRVGLLTCLETHDTNRICSLILFYFLHTVVTDQCLFFFKVCIHMERLPDLIHWKRRRPAEDWRVSGTTQIYLHFGKFYNSKAIKLSAYIYIFFKGTLCSF